LVNIDFFDVCRCSCSDESIGTQTKLVAERHLLVVGEFPFFFFFLFACVWIVTVYLPSARLFTGRTVREVAEFDGSAGGAGDWLRAGKNAARKETEQARKDGVCRFSWEGKR